MKSILVLSSLLPLCLAVPPSDVTPVPKPDVITPIPIDRTDPNVKEFRRIDTNKDKQITFTEFLLSDRPFIEHLSRKFHGYDKNGDGLVTQAEYEEYHKKQDHQGSGRRGGDFFNKFNHHDNIFEPGFFNSHPAFFERPEGSIEDFKDLRSDDFERKSITPKH